MVLSCENTVQGLLLNPVLFALAWAWQRDSLQDTFFDPSANGRIVHTQAISHLTHGQQFFHPGFPSLYTVMTIMQSSA